MSRIALAFRSFFAILFTGKLPGDIAQVFGFTQAPRQAATVQPAPKPVKQAGPTDGALQILSILQQESRLIDFLMEDISAYSDEQVGAAVRNVHEQSGKALARHLRLAPVIDGVEGTFTKIEGSDAGSIRLVGNVPASGKAPGGVLRHKGWRAEKVDLPPLAAGQSAPLIAPAELEIE